MIDDERLKALKMVTDAKDSIEDALPTAKAAQIRQLKEVLHCLEEIETDLNVALVDESMSELEEFRQHLLELNGGLDKNDPDLREAVRKVNAAAKEIPIAIEAAKTVITVPEKLT